MNPDFVKIRKDLVEHHNIIIQNLIFNLKNKPTIKTLRNELKEENHYQNMNKTQKTVFNKTILKPSIEALKQSKITLKTEISQAKINKKNALEKLRIERLEYKNARPKVKREKKQKAQTIDEIYIPRETELLSIESGFKSYKYIFVLGREFEPRDVDAQTEVNLLFDIIANKLSEQINDNKKYCLQIQAFQFSPDNKYHKVSKNLYSPVESFIGLKNDVLSKFDESEYATKADFELSQSGYLEPGNIVTFTIYNDQEQGAGRVDVRIHLISTVARTKKSVIQINNNDNMCAARALAVQIAKDTNDKQYDHIKRGLQLDSKRNVKCSDLQKLKAQDLLSNAGLGDSVVGRALT
ncbi:hypothetical protein JXM83_02560, partial [Candidatus Woesearchaeota archaeon]|nr:hypothetical protein [Candidatus Woesearchaeota archaeon]